VGKDREISKFEILKDEILKDNKVYSSEEMLNQELIGYVKDYAEECKIRKGEYSLFKDDNNIDGPTLKLFLEKLRESSLNFGNQSGIKEFLRKKLGDLQSNLDNSSPSSKDKLKKEFNKWQNIENHYLKIIEYETLMESYNKGSNLAAVILVLHSSKEELPNFKLKVKLSGIYIANFGQTSASQPKIYEAEKFDFIAGDSRMAGVMFTHSETKAMIEISKNEEMMFETIDEAVRKYNLNLEDYKLTFYVSTQRDTCCLCDEMIRSFAVYLDDRLRENGINFSDNIDCSISYSEPYTNKDEMKEAIERIIQEDQEFGKLKEIAISLAGKEELIQEQINRLLFRTIKIGVACYNKADNYEDVGNFNFGEIRELKSENILTKDIKVENIVKTIHKLIEKGFEDRLKGALGSSLKAMEVRYRKHQIQKEGRVDLLDCNTFDDGGDDIGGEECKVSGDMDRSPVIDQNNISPFLVRSGPKIGNNGSPVGNSGVIIGPTPGSFYKASSRVSNGSSDSIMSDFTDHVARSLDFGDTTTEKPKSVVEKPSQVDSGERGDNNINHK
jgi:hypothetical protein